MGRLVVVCHVWPSITPLTVWDLPYFVWVGFAAASDEWSRRQKELASG